MKKNRIIFSILSLIILGYFLYSYYPSINIFFYKVFKKSGYISMINRDGNGKIFFYSEGHIEKSMPFSNGAENGWRILYYDNGQIKNKIYFKKNRANGGEFEFYKNGKVKYVGKQKGGKRFGDFYWYLETGQLDSYSAFDIDGKPFFVADYNSTGSITTMDGLILSRKIYSLNEKNDTLQIYGVQESSFSNIKNLYIVGATPSNLNLQTNVVINNAHYDNLKIVDNLIKIDNAFSVAGAYHINISCRLVDKQGKVINGINFDFLITKK